MKWVGVVAPWENQAGGCLEAVCCVGMEWSVAKLGWGWGVVMVMGRVGRW